MIFLNKKGSNAENFSPIGATICCERVILFYNENFCR
jgi:hypothetical protein